MPAIRDKSLHSRRMGYTLNGIGAVGQSDLEAGLSVYDPYTTQPAQSSNIFSDLLSFGTSYFNAQNQPQQQQVRYVATSAGTSPFGGTNMLLLAAAGLAAVFILTMPKGRK